MADPSAPVDRGSLIGAVVMLLAMAGVMLPILFGSLSRSRTTIADCGGPKAPLTQITGTLRQAGADFYLVSDIKDRDWHLVRSRCASKSRAVCTPAIRQDEAWLGSQLGETVTAWRCAYGIVEYTISGRTFHR